VVGFILELLNEYFHLIISNICVILKLLKITQYIMETSILIAKIIGPTYWIVWIAILFNRKFYKKMLYDFSKNITMFYIASLLPLLAGLVIILNHNIWISDWTVIITIFWWLAFIKWVCLLIFPEFNLRMIKNLKKSDSLLVAWWIFAASLWAYLTYMWNMS